MRDPDLQLRVLERAAAELPDYLLSAEIFWRLSGPADLPNLTLGGLELARRSLVERGGELDPEHHRKARRLAGEIDRIRRRWAVAWERKAASELKARLNQWRAYLQDLAEQPGVAEDYPQQVRVRAMAEYLIEQAGRQPEVAGLRQVLAGLDGRLRAGFEAGPFVWEPSLEPAYPSEPYWYLYGRPRA